MKRSTFFKSLLGITIAPAAVKWIGDIEDEQRMIEETKPIIKSVQRGSVSIPTALSDFNTGEQLNPK